jgi:hypothetical protein
MYNELDRIRCNYPIGDLFIAIQNEWTPMDVLVITDYQQCGSSHIPVGKSVINGESRLLMSKLMNYSDDMIRVLKKLDPYERYAVCANYPSIIGESKTDSNLITPFEEELTTDEIIEKVRLSQEV